MTKQRKILLSSLCLCLLILILSFSLLHRKTKEETPKSQTTEATHLSTDSTNTVKQENHLSFSQLQEKEGTGIKDLGIWQISSIVFKGKTKAILATDNGKEMTFPIKVTKKENNEITLPTLKYAPMNLVIGKSVGLAQKGKQYYMYQIDQ